MNIQNIPSMTSDEIYEDMCLKIERLEYMPGEKLSENELCGIYHVSRHVVRNALALLKGRRLVEVYPQRGTFVSLIDMEYIQDILYLREAVEQEALARIMQMSDRTQVLQRMRVALGAQQELREDTDYHEKFYALDNIFHEALLDAIGRPNVTKLISQPYIHIRRWRNFEIRSKKRLIEITNEHENLICAIEKGDGVAARDCLHNHLDTVNRYSKGLKEKEAQYFLN